MFSAIFGIKRPALIAVILIFTLCSFAQTTYTWNGSTSTSWTNAANWTPGTGFPGSGDNAIIVNAGNVPTLAANTQITNLTVTSGTLDLGSFSLTATGNHTFTAGTVQNGTVTASAGGTSVFTATTFSSNCVVSITSSTVTINGGTFNGTTTLIQNGTGNSTGTGGATFNGTTILQNSGSGNFRTNTGMVFNGTTQLKTTSSGYLLLELTGGSTYNGDVTMTVTGSGNVRACYLGATAFNGNITLENTGSGSVYFCEQASATATLANTKTISVGAAGFSSGNLYLYRFTQTGGTAQSLAFTGTSVVYMNNATTFNGNFSMSGIDMYISSCTFNGTFSLTKSGGSNNANTGGNTFNSTATINNTSGGYWLTGNGTADIFNGDLTISNTGTERVMIAYNSVGNQLNGNVTVSQSSTGVGIALGWGSGSGLTQAATKNISIGGGGYSGGYLQLYNYTQNGSAASSLTLTGTASFYVYGPSVLGGAISVTAPDIYVRGLTANGAATFTKTGGTTNHNNGSLNTFNSTVVINQQSSGGYFMLGYNSADVFNDDITVSATGSGGIYLGYPNGTGTPSLAATKTVNIGGAGFSAGFLYFGHFTQNGNAALNLSLTGTSTLYFGNSSSIGGNVTISSPGLFFNGCTFSGTVNATKTGSSSDGSSGGNVFNGATTLANTGSGYLMMGNGSADIFNQDLALNNSGSERIMMGYNSASNQFNGNISVSNTGSGLGIVFCTSTGSSAVLAATKNISIGAGGFTTGYLIIYRFTQNGTAASSLTLTGSTTYFQTGNSSVFGGALTVSSPRILLDGATFNGVCNFTKTGANGEWSTGGNTFNAQVTVNSTASGYFGFASSNPDIYNDDLYVNNNGTERIFFANTSVGNQYNGNVIVTQIGSSVGIAFGWTSSSTSTMAATKTFSIGGAGFSVGYLQIARLTQNGSAAIGLTTTGSSSVYLGPGSSFGGAVSVTSPDIYPYGATYASAVVYTKTGGTNNHNNGNQNIFNSALTINQQSNGGYIMVGYNSNDQFNDDITVTSTGSGGINLGWTSGTGTPTLASGKTVLIGGAGFSDGYLRFGSFTQLGSAAINLTLTGAADLEIRNANSNCVFGGSFTATAPDIYVQGGTFNGATSFTKTGSASNHNNGVQNIFNSTLSIDQQGSAYFMLGYNSNDLFNDNITVTASGTGGIYLGFSSGTGTPTLASGKTVMVGAGGFSSGFLYFGTFTQLGNAAITLPFTGSTTVLYSRNSVFGGNFTATSPDFNITGSTFNGTFSATKTGTPNSGSAGGNTFNSTSEFVNSGSGYFLLGNGTADIFNGDVTFSNSGSERILPCYSSAGNMFNGNIIVSSTGSSTGINFCSQSASTATLAATKTISIGGSGYTSGYLILQRFTQLGSAAITLNMSNTAGYLQFGPSSSIGGAVTSSSPGLYFNGCTFSSAVTSTKTGSTSDNSSGNNVFNGVTTLTNSGAGQFLLGNGSTDQFNTTATFNNTGSNSIYVAYNSSNNIFGGDVTFSNTPTSASSGIYVNSYSSGTQFNGNIVVNSTNGNGVQFGTNTGSATLAATKTISVGGSGFSAGTLLLRNFTQTGATAQSLLLTGTATLTFGPSSAFGGDVTSTSGRLYFNGCTFSGTTNCSKTGANNDAGTGGNIFTGVSTMNNSGSGYLLFGNGTRDQWLSDVTFNNTGSNLIYIAYNSTNNSFAGNVTLNNSGSSGSGSGIRMMDAASATASIAGNLVLNNNAASGSNNGIRICEANSTSLTVTGTTTVTNTNTNTANYIRFAQGTSSSVTFNGDVSVTNNGTSGSTNVVHFSYTGSNVFNGNITLSSNGGTGVYFGANAGTCTQADNKTINTSSFTGGNLSLRNFTQSGPTTGNSSNVSISGTNMTLSFNNCSFYDNVTGAGQLIDCINSTFRNAATLTKISGNANNYWTGGNTFNGTTLIINQSSTYILGMGNGTADTYNGNVTFTQSAAGALRPNYNSTCVYNGDVTFSAPSSTAITCGGGGGTASFGGGNAQSINLSAGSTPVFTRLTINKTANNVTLNTRINISTTLTLTAGNLITTSTNILNMNNASTTTIGSASSYVDGPMNYDMALSGSRTLNFPVGSGGDWRPVELTAVHNAATSYTYQCSLTVANANSLGWTLPGTVTHVSYVHYWDIARLLTSSGATSTANISGNQTIKLYYDSNDGVTDPSNLTICKNTPSALTTWVDIGGTGASSGTGSVTSTSSPTAFTSYSRFTLGNKTSGSNPLPVELLEFTAVPDGDQVDVNWSTASETNNDYFMVERSADGASFEPLKKVMAYGTGNSSVLQEYNALDEQPLAGLSYYRLMQRDKSGAHTYSTVVPVYFGSAPDVSVFPNPANDVLHLLVGEKTITEKGLICLVHSDLGQVVMSFAMGTQHIRDVDISTLPSGVYTVTLLSDLSTVTKKIVVRH